MSYLNFDHWSEDLSGKEVNGFKLVKRLGQGVSGSAYLSEKDGKYVVLKVIVKNPYNEEEYKREITSLEKLMDYCEKYILCYIETFSDSRYFYIVSEYLGNYITLVEYSQSSHSDNTKKKLIENLVTGIEYLHTKGVYHRDAHFQNIMVNPKTLDIKYIDFGSSCYRCDEEFISDFKYLGESIYYLITSQQYSSEFERDDKEEETDAEAFDFVNSMDPILVFHYDEDSDYVLKIDLKTMIKDGIAGKYKLVKN